MRPLHRPMFRYGGPIKEGVMSGIREPKRKGGSMGTHAALVGNPIFPKTAGREHHEIDYRFNPIKDAAKKTLTNIKTKPLSLLNPFKKLKSAKILTQQIPKWWSKIKPTGVPRLRRTDQTLPIGMRGPLSSSGITSIPLRSRILPWMSRNKGWTAAGGIGATSEPGQAILKAPFGIAKWTGEALTPKWAEKYLPWEVPGVESAYETPWGKDKKEDEKELTADELRIKQLEKLLAAKEEPVVPEKSDEEIRAERIQKYRDIMDIKGMNKRAAYDSLIDASKLVSESGDFKEDIKSGNLINQIIQATSKQFDKPSKTKDAIDTLILKGEIEADIASGKAGTYQKNIDTVASNLNISKEDATKMILNKPLNLREQVTSDMAATKQAAVTHRGVVSSTKKQYPKAQVMLTQDEYEEVVGDDSTGEAFIKTTVTDKLSKDPNAKVAGIYIVGKEVVQVDGAGNTLTLFP